MVVERLLCMASPGYRKVRQRLDTLEAHFAELEIRRREPRLAPRARFAGNVHILFAGRPEAAEES